MRSMYVRCQRFFHLYHNTPFMLIIIKSIRVLFTFNLNAKPNGCFEYGWYHDLIYAPNVRIHILAVNAEN